METTPLNDAIVTLHGEQMRYESAIAQALAEGGGAIYLPPGDYHVTPEQMKQVRDGVCLCGPDEPPRPTLQFD